MALHVLRLYNKLLYPVISVTYARVHMETHTVCILGALYPVEHLECITLTSTLISHETVTSYNRNLKLVFC